MNGDLALDSNTTAVTPTPIQQVKQNYHTIVLAAAGAQMEEWWGQLGPCDTALLCTVSRQAGHQPRAHSSGDYHGYYLLFTATTLRLVRVDVITSAASCSVEHSPAVMDAGLQNWSSHLLHIPAVCCSDG